MVLLQTTTVETPNLIPADSLRAVTQMMIQQAHDDPTTFWTTLLQQAIQFGLKVFAALLVYMIGAWLIKYVRKILARIFTRRNTERTLASFITSLVSISLTVLLIIVAVSTLGVDTTSLAALLAAGGMAIGMALSGTVQNFAGGIMLLAFKPFKAGDFIEAQGYRGKVTDVTIVNTKILTDDNRVVIVPNGVLSNGNIDNYSAKPLRRVDLEVSVAYGVDADKCIAKLLEIANADTRVLHANTEGASEPFVALSSLNANDITFVVRVWAESAQYWPVRYELIKQFYTQLPPAGFDFDYPRLDVRVLNNNENN